MYATARLTWDDEVRISDALHEARLVQSRLDGAEAASPEDIAILERAAEAKDELVISHSDLARRVAYEVLHGGQASATVDFEDLVQTGMIAMYSCANSFDARRRSDGLKKDTGNRFSVYSRMYIKREMYRALKRSDATLSGSIATVERTREWLQQQSTLEAELGRRPTPLEVSEACGIPVSSIDITLMGRPAVLGESVGQTRHDPDGDAPLLDPPEQDRTDDVDEALVSEQYLQALDRVLRDVLPPDEVDAFSLWTGVDVALPRPVAEVARALDIKVPEAAELIRQAVARMRHPQNVWKVHALASEALANIRGGESGVDLMRKRSA